MKYYLRIDGQQEGPFTEDEVEDLHGVGRISKGTPCRNTYDPDWKTVDDHVPRAKWVSTPHGIPPKLSSDQPSPKKSFSVPVAHDRPEVPWKRSAWEGFFDKPDRIDFGLNAVYAGIACVVLENLCGQLMLGGFFGIGGIFAGVIATVLGRVRSGILILVAVALTIFGWEMYVAHRIKSAGEEMLQEWKSMFGR